MQYQSKKSKGISEDTEITRDNASYSKIKNSNVELSKKRERSQESLIMGEKAYKTKKISESQKEFMEVNEMSTTQIGREKEKLKKEIEAKQKKLNYLEIYEKLKNEINKEIQKTIIKESKKSKFNFDKDRIFKIIKEVTLNIYKKNEKSLNPQVKSKIREDMDTILTQIENNDNSNLETVLTTYFDNNNKKEEANEINLDENEDLNNTRKNISKSEGQKKNQKEKNEEDSKPKRISKSKLSDNIIFNDTIYSKINKKSVAMNPSKNSRTNIYSYKCLTNNLNFAIQKGIKIGMFSIEIENNGSLSWPQNKTFLEIDNSKSSLKGIQNILLNPLNPGERASYNIMINHNLKSLYLNPCPFFLLKL